MRVEREEREKREMTPYWLERFFSKVISCTQLFQKTTLIYKTILSDNLTLTLIKYQESGFIYHSLNLAHINVSINEISGQ